MEDIWGKDCELFKPERWLGEDGAFRPESPFKYPVIHAGPRMCLGKEMSYIQMKSIVACVLERFSFRFVGSERRPGLVLSLTLRMEGGLSMQSEQEELDNHGHRDMLFSLGQRNKARIGFSDQCSTGATLFLYLSLNSQLDLCINPC
jgi:hypothetical protein